MFENIKFLNDGKTSVGLNELGRTVVNLFLVYIQTANGIASQFKKLFLKSEGP